MHTNGTVACPGKLPRCKSLAAKPLRCDGCAGRWRPCGVLESRRWSQALRIDVLADLGAEVLKVKLPAPAMRLRRLAAAQGRRFAVVEGHQPRGTKKGLHGSNLAKKEGPEAATAAPGRGARRFWVGIFDDRTRLDAWGIKRAGAGDQPRDAILRVTGFGKTGTLSQHPRIARRVEG